MIRILASVRDRDEALDALAAGADLIDLKEPAAGALGAVAPEAVARAVEAVAGRRPVSATIGDMAFDADTVVPAVERVAGCGVDYVKIGLYESRGAQACLAALAPLAASGVRLVGVFLADRDPERPGLDELAAAGFAGAMLDTADKGAGPLTQVLAMADIARFVAGCRRHRLLCGLAGSLGAAEAAALAPLGPDYLGFRGALCGGGDRSGRFEASRLERIRRQLAGAAPADAA